MSEVRPYQTEDYEAVAEILQATGLYDADRHYETAFERHKTSTLVAEIGDHAVRGLVVVNEGIMPMLWSLAVAPEAQRQGIGTELLIAGMTKLRLAGHEDVEVFVEGENERLQNWYRKRGFSSRSGALAPQDSGLYRSMWRYIDPL